MYKQLVQPNLSVKGSIGYCLAFAQKIFSVPSSNYVPNAWTAWSETKYKHNDRNFPKDVAIVMWYSYILDGINEGHVTVNVPGKGIYSSPWKYGTDHAVLGSIEQVEQTYTTHDANGKPQPVKFVGWSEDIEGVRVAQPDIINDMPTPAEVNLAIAAVFNRQATAQEKSLYSTRTWGNFLQTLYNNSTSQRTKAANFDKVQTALNEANAKLKSVQQTPITATLDPAVVAEIQATNENVSWIKSLLSKIFK